MTITHRSAEDIYTEYALLLNSPLLDGGNRLKPTPAYEARLRLLTSLRNMYETTSDLECLSLREEGDKKRAIRQERLFEVRKRIWKHLDPIVTVRKAVAEWEQGGQQALEELLADRLYGRFIARFEGTPSEVLERFFFELNHLTRRADDSFEYFASNPSLTSEDIERLISVAKSEEDYGRLIAHPNLREDQFARIAANNPVKALLREAGLIFRFKYAFRPLRFNKEELVPPLTLPKSVLRKVMRVGAKSRNPDLLLHIFWDDRIDAKTKREALNQSLPNRVRDKDRSVRWLRTLRSKIASLDEARLVSLSSEARVMLLSYDHTPKRVLRLLSASGITTDEVMSGSMFPRQTVIYGLHQKMTSIAA